MQIPEPQVFEPPTRLPTLDEAKEYLLDIDFTSLKDKMASDVREGGMGWSAAKIDYVEQQYKRWLFLRRKYEWLDMPPSFDIDQFWHFHMLDTRAYLRDTQVAFGYYLHHFPYFGVRGETDMTALRDAWENVQRLHLEEFGEEIYDFD